MFSVCCRESPVDKSVDIFPGAVFRYSNNNIINFNLNFNVLQLRRKELSLV